MTTIELLADSLARNLELLRMTLADFSDADLLVRPCSGANHAAWQLGHLACSEAYMLGRMKAGAAPELPAGFAEKFNAKTAAVDDPAKLAGRAELLAQLSKVREASIRWVRSLSDKGLGQPSPETLHGFVPTVGHMVLMYSGHVAMHVGQLQVIRRKLGKPVLF